MNNQSIPESAITLEDLQKKFRKWEIHYDLRFRNLSDFVELLHNDFQTNWKRLINHTVDTDTLHNDINKRLAVLENRALFLEGRFTKMSRRMFAHGENVKRLETQVYDLNSKIDLLMKTLVRRGLPVLPARQKSFRKMVKNFFRQK